MKKQVGFGIAVLALLAMMVTPVMAEGGQSQFRWQGNVFALVGEVTALDSTAKTITVQVYTGNQPIKAYVGEELLVKTGPNTLFLRYGETKCTVITFDDIAVGDYISANGKVVTDGFFAKRVTVDVPLHYRNDNY